MPPRGSGGTAPTLPQPQSRGRGFVRTSAQISNNSAHTLSSSSGRPSASQRDGSPGGVMSSLDFRTSDEGFDDSLPDDSIDQVPATDEPDEMRPSKRQRRIPHPQHDQYEQELRPKLQKLNRLTRWNYFIEFSTEGMHEIIIAAFGEISVDSYEYSYARQKIPNLATQVKLYDDICDKNDNCAVVAHWNDILAFWNDMSSARQYKGVDRGVFKEKFQRQPRSKKRDRSARPISDILSFEEEAPQKTSANTTRY